jgi:cytidylate kinase
MKSKSTNRCVSIAGSCASGKTTLARSISARVRTTGVLAVSVETGRMYRAVARHLVISNVPLGDEEACARHLAATLMTIDKDGELRINGDAVATDGTEAEGAHAAQLARHPTLRANLTGSLQTFIASSVNAGKVIIIDARDGPHIWPSGLHFWLETPLQQRAQRRAAQTGQPLTEIIELLQMRDEADRGFGRIDHQVAAVRKDIYILDGRKPLNVLVDEVLARLPLEEQNHVQR